MSTIEFFWDPVSPYSYLASTRIENIARAHDAELRWRPFLLGAVMKAAGTTAPVTIPAKGDHLMKDIERWATLYRVGFKMPKRFPANTIVAARAAFMVSKHDASDGARFARALMAAHWRDARDISDPAELGAIITNFGLDAAELLEAADSDEARAGLRANTDEAVTRGAFGAPTFFVGDAMFWGNDRLDMLAAHLAGQLQA